MSKKIILKRVTIIFILLLFIIIFIFFSILPFKVPKKTDLNSVSLPMRVNKKTSETHSSKTPEIASTVEASAPFTEPASSQELLTPSESVTSQLNEQSIITDLQVSVTNLRGTTGSTLYHDGLPTKNEKTDLVFVSKSSNVYTYDYYFLNKVSIPSYNRKADSVQRGQLLIELLGNNQVRITITGGVPSVTNYGTDIMSIDNYNVGESKTISVSKGDVLTDLLVQQSFGQSPLGSINNLSGDYQITFS